MNKTLSTALTFLITLLTPIFLTLLGIRILLTPIFPEIEYRMPYFPPDEKGFSQGVRIHLAQAAIEYLNNDNKGIESLGRLRFPNGTSLYKESELNHMIDVKNLIQFALKTFLGTTFLLTTLGAWANFNDKKQLYIKGLIQGGWLTLFLTASLGILASINFWEFFTQFHHLFFEGNTWVFEYSDTLIRLFPMRLWQDAFLMEGIIVVGGGLTLVIGLRKFQGE